MISKVPLTSNILRIFNHLKYFSENNVLMEIMKGGVGVGGRMCVEVSTFKITSQTSEKGTLDR